MEGNGSIVFLKRSTNHLAGQNSSVWSKRHQSIGITNKGSKRSWGFGVLNLASLLPLTDKFTQCRPEADPGSPRIEVGQVIDIVIKRESCSHNEIVHHF